MKPSMQLYLDLGDSFTKGLAVRAATQRRVRFPSVVAHRLLGEGEGRESLLLGGDDTMLRPTDFDPAQFPRTRSYPGADAVLHAARPTAPKADVRFAGWQAATYGADRQLLGHHPTREIVDALIRKALILARPENGAVVDLVLVVDAGAKADALHEYVERPDSSVVLELRTLRRPERRRVQVSLRARTLDAADCAAAAVPAAVEPERVQRLLLVDIGYLRTKLAVVSPRGCESQEVLDGVGAAICVGRVLRDGQEYGLVEDELAVMRALEKSAGSPLRIAGRSFDVGSVLESASESLALELERSVRRMALTHYQQQGEMCRAVAVLGGGAAFVGTTLASRLRSAQVGLSDAWVADDSSFLLLAGAQRRHSAR